MKKKKRRKDAPYVPPKKSRAEASADKKRRYEATKARIDRMLARTRAGRAERDAAMEGAELEDLADDLPVVEFPHGRSTPGIRAKHAIDTSPLPAFHPPAEYPAEVVDELAAVAAEAKKSAAALETAREVQPRKRKAYRGGLGDQLDLVKIEAITNALIAEQGNISAAADRLGLARQSVQRMIRDLGIKRPTDRKNRTVSRTETAASAAEESPARP